MIRNFYILYFIFACIVTVGCSSDDDYNADTAISFYSSDSYDKMVSSVTTVSNVDGKEYKWTYDFVYDAQNRIKEINGVMKYYYKGQLCNSISQVKYYFDKASLNINYVKEDTYPYKSDWNTIQKGKYSGAFNKNGTIANFYTFDCEYSGMLLKKAYVDGGDEYALEHDRHNNIIKAYRLDGDSPEEGTLREYNYIKTDSEGNSIVNKTNFDFASFFGYNIVERLVPANENYLYAIFQLGAFGMFGSRCTHLPDGVWEFDDDGFPVSYIDSNGRKTDITYKQ